MLRSIISTATGGIVKFDDVGSSVKLRFGGLSLYSVSLDAAKLAGLTEALLFPLTVESVLAHYISINLNSPIPFRRRAALCVKIECPHIRLKVHQDASDRILSKVSRLHKAQEAAEIAADIRTGEKKQSYFTKIKNRITSLLIKLGSALIPSITAEVTAASFSINFGDDIAVPSLSCSVGSVSGSLLILEALDPIQLDAPIGDCRIRKINCTFGDDEIVTMDKLDALLLPKLVDKNEAPSESVIRTDIEVTLNKVTVNFDQSQLHALCLFYSRIKRCHLSLTQYINIELPLRRLVDDKRRECGSRSGAELWRSARLRYALWRCNQDLACQTDARESITGLKPKRFWFNQIVEEAGFQGAVRWIAHREWAEEILRLWLKNQSRDRSQDLSLTLADDMECVIKCVLNDLDKFSQVTHAFEILSIDDMIRICHDVCASEYKPHLIYQDAVDTFDIYDISDTHDTHDTPGTAHWYDTFEPIDGEESWDDDEITSSKYWAVNLYLCQCDIALTPGSAVQMKMEIRSVSCIADTVDGCVSVKCGGLKMLSPSHSDSIYGHHRFFDEPTWIRSTSVSNMHLYSTDPGTYTAALDVPSTEFTIEKHQANVVIPRVFVMVNLTKFVYNLNISKWLIIDTPHTLHTPPTAHFVSQYLGGTEPDINQERSATVKVMDVSCLFVSKLVCSEDLKFALSLDSEILFLNTELSFSMVNLHTTPASLPSSCRTTDAECVEVSHSSIEANVTYFAAKVNTNETYVNFVESTRNHSVHSLAGLLRSALKQHKFASELTDLEANTQRWSTECALFTHIAGPSTLQAIHESSLFIKVKPGGIVPPPFLGVRLRQKLDGCHRDVFVFREESADTTLRALTNLRFSADSEVATLIFEWMQAVKGSPFKTSSSEARELRLQMTQKKKRKLPLPKRAVYMKNPWLYSIIRHSTGSNNVESHTGIVACPHRLEVTFDLMILNLINMPIPSRAQCLWPLNTVLKRQQETIQIVCSKISLNSEASSGWSYIDSIFWISDLYIQTWNRQERFSFLRTHQKDSVFAVSPVVGASDSPPVPDVSSDTLSDAMWTKMKYANVNQTLKRVNWNEYCTFYPHELRDSPDDMYEIPDASHFLKIQLKIAGPASDAFNADVSVELAIQKAIEIDYSKPTVAALKNITTLFPNKVIAPYATEAVSELLERFPMKSDGPDEPSDCILSRPSKTQHVRELIETEGVLEPEPFAMMGHLSISISLEIVSPVRVWLYDEGVQRYMAQFRGCRASICMRKDGSSMSLSGSLSQFQAWNAVDVLKLIGPVCDSEPTADVFFDVEIINRKSYSKYGCVDPGIYVDVRLGSFHVSFLLSEILGLWLCFLDQVLGSVSAKAGINHELDITQMRHFSSLFFKSELADLVFLLNIGHLSYSDRVALYTTLVTMQRPTATLIGDEHQQLFCVSFLLGLAQHGLQADPDLLEVADWVQSLNDTKLFTKLRCAARLVRPRAVVLVNHEMIGPSYDHYLLDLDALIISNVPEFLRQECLRTYGDTDERDATYVTSIIGGPTYEVPTHIREQARWPRGTAFSLTQLQPRVEALFETGDELAQWLQLSQELPSFAGSAHHPLFGYSDFFKFIMRNFKLIYVPGHPRSNTSINTQIGHLDLVCGVSDRIGQVNDLFKTPLIIQASLWQPLDEEIPISLSFTDESLQCLLGIMFGNILSGSPSKPPTTKPAVQRDIDRADIMVSLDIGPVQIDLIDKNARSEFKLTVDGIDATVDLFTLKGILLNLDLSNIQVALLSQPALSLKRLSVVLGMGPTGLAQPSKPMVFSHGVKYRGWVCPNLPVIPEDLYSGHDTFYPGLNMLRLITVTMDDIRVNSGLRSLADFAVFILRDIIPAALKGMSVSPPASGDTTHPHVPATMVCSLNILDTSLKLEVKSRREDQSQTPHCINVNLPQIKALYGMSDLVDSTQLTLATLFVKPDGTCSISALDQGRKSLIGQIPSVTASMADEAAARQGARVTVVVEVHNRLELSVDEVLVSSALDGLAMVPLLMTSFKELQADVKQDSNPVVWVDPLSEPRVKSPTSKSHTDKSLRGVLKVAKGVSCAVSTNAVLKLVGKKGMKTDLPMAKFNMESSTVKMEQSMDTFSAPTQFAPEVETYDSASPIIRVGVKLRKISLGIWHTSCLTFENVLEIPGELTAKLGWTLDDAPKPLTLSTSQESVRVTVTPSTLFGLLALKDSIVLSLDEDGLDSHPKPFSVCWINNGSSYPLTFFTRVLTLKSFATHDPHTDKPSGDRHELLSGERIKLTIPDGVNTLMWPEDVCVCLTLEHPLWGATTFTINRLLYSNSMASVPLWNGRAVAMGVSMGVSKFVDPEISIVNQDSLLKNRSGRSLNFFWTADDSQGLVCREGTDLFIPFDVPLLQMVGCRTPIEVGRATFNWASGSMSERTLIQGQHEYTVLIRTELERLMGTAIVRSIITVSAPIEIENLTPLSFMLFLNTPVMISPAAIPLKPFQNPTVTYDLTQSARTEISLLHEHWRGAVFMDTSWKELDRSETRDGFLTLQAVEPPYSHYCGPSFKVLIQAAGRAQCMRVSIHFDVVILSSWGFSSVIVGQQEAAPIESTSISEVRPLQALIGPHFTMYCVSSTQITATSLKIKAEGILNATPTLVLSGKEIANATFGQQLDGSVVQWEIGNFDTPSPPSGLFRMADDDVVKPFAPDENSWPKVLLCRGTLPIINQTDQILEFVVSEGPRYEIAARQSACLPIQSLRAGYIHFRPVDTQGPRPMQTLSTQSSNDDFVGTPKPVFVTPPDESELKPVAYSWSSIRTTPWHGVRCSNTMSVGHTDSEQKWHPFTVSWERTSTSYALIIADCPASVSRVPFAITLDGKREWAQLDLQNKITSECRSLRITKKQTPMPLLPLTEHWEDTRIWLKTNIDPVRSVTLSASGKHGWVFDTDGLRDAMPGENGPETFVVSNGNWIFREINLTSIRDQNLIGLDARGLLGASQSKRCASLYQTFCPRPLGHVSVSVPFLSISLAVGPVSEELMIIELADTVVQSTVTSTHAVADLEIGKIYFSHRGLLEDTPFFVNFFTVGSKEEPGVKFAVCLCTDKRRPQVIELFLLQVGLVKVSLDIKSLDNLAFLGETLINILSAIQADIERDTALAFLSPKAEMCEPEPFRFFLNPSSHGFVNPHYVGPMNMKLSFLPTMLQTYRSDLFKGDSKFAKQLGFPMALKILPLVGAVSKVPIDLPPVLLTRPAGEALSLLELSPIIQAQLKPKLWRQVARFIGHMDSLGQPSMVVVSLTNGFLALAGKEPIGSKSGVDRLAQEAEFEASPKPRKKRPRTGVREVTRNVLSGMSKMTYHVAQVAATLQGNEVKQHELLHRWTESEDSPITKRLDSAVRKHSAEITPPRRNSALQKVGLGIANVFGAAGGATAELAKGLGGTGLDLQSRQKTTRGAHRAFAGLFGLYQGADALQSEMISLIERPLLELGINLRKDGRLMALFTDAIAANHVAIYGDMFTLLNLMDPTKPVMVKIFYNHLTVLRLCTVRPQQLEIAAHGHNDVLLTMANTDESQRLLVYLRRQWLIAKRSSFFVETQNKPIDQSDGL